jgi:hypothetical protein
MPPILAHVMFILSFLLGWAVWPESAGLADFIALCAVALAVTGLFVTLDETMAG